MKGEPLFLLRRAGVDCHGYFMPPGAKLSLLRLRQSGFWGELPFPYTAMYAAAAYPTRSV